MWFAPNSRGAGLRNREPWRCNSSRADHSSVVQQQNSGLLSRTMGVQFSPEEPTLPGRLIRRTAPFEGAYVGANPAPAAIFLERGLSPIRSGRKFLAIFSFATLLTHASRCELGQLALQSSTKKLFCFASQPGFLQCGENFRVVEISFHFEGLGIFNRRVTFHAGYRSDCAVHGFYAFAAAKMHAGNLK